MAARTGSQLPAPAITPAQCWIPPVPPLASSHLRCLEPAPDIRIALLSCPLPPPALAFSSDGGFSSNLALFSAHIPSVSLQSTKLKLVVDREEKKAALSTLWTGVLSTRNTVDSGRAVPTRMKTGKKRLVVSCTICALWGLYWPRCCAHGSNRAVCLALLPHAHVCWERRSRQTFHLLSFPPAAPSLESVLKSLDWKG